MVVKRERYSLHYQENEQGILCLTCYELNEGYKLFEIATSYATNIASTHYYIIEQNQRAAKKLFLKKYPWLDKVKNIRPCTEDETETVLTSPGHFIIV